VGGDAHRPRAVAVRRPAAAEVGTPAMTGTTAAASRHRHAAVRRFAGAQDRPPTPLPPPWCTHAPVCTCCGLTHAPQEVATGWGAPSLPRTSLAPSARATGQGALAGAGGAGGATSFQARWALEVEVEVERQGGQGGRRRA
jgi:hypothetical protein